MDPTAIPLLHPRGTSLPHGEPSFHEIVAEQLAHAPWLLLSIGAHAIVFFVLAALPVPPAKEHAPQVSLAVAEQAPEIAQLPITDEQLVEERASVEPVLQDAELAPTEMASDATGDASLADGTGSAGAGDGVASAFANDGWNTAPGLGGGAGGKSGNRPGGRARLGSTGRSGRLTAQSIEDALVWLRRHQDADGRWDADEFMKHDVDGVPCTGPGDPLHDVGVTALALLAFLGDGSTLKAGPYQDVIKRGVMWLRSQQDEDSGLIGTAASHHFIYDHVIATLALCEAYGLSRYRTLQPVAQKAIDYLEAHRNPYGCWRYQKQGGDNDVSVTGWAVLAYVSAKEFGLRIDANALQYADSYLDEMTDSNGRTGYVAKGGRSSRHHGQHEIDFPADRSECMTAVGLLCKYFLGHHPKTTPMMANQAQLLLRKPPRWAVDGKGSCVDHYSWYYGTYAMYQIGGTAWAQWSKALGDAVVKTQCRDGNGKGSWDPEDAWGQDGGRVYSTAILALTLEAYYRYPRVIGGR